MSLPKIYHPDRNREFWKYAGPDDGAGQIHVVAMADAHEIVTLGIGSGGRPDRSWLGTPAEFRQQFSYAGGQP